MTAPRIETIVNLFLPTCPRNIKNLKIESSPRLRTCSICKSQIERRTVSFKLSYYNGFKIFGADTYCKNCVKEDTAGRIGVVISTVRKGIEYYRKLERPDGGQVKLLQTFQGFIKYIEDNF